MKAIMTIFCLILSCAASAADCTPLGLVPLPDLGADLYHGFQGGLYPGGSNEVPDIHAENGDAIAHSLAGQPVVLMSIGMSNATEAFWADGSHQDQPNPWTFAGQCSENPLVSPDVTIVNGARFAQVAETWADPDGWNYTRIRINVLEPRGLAPEDVTVLWVKLANKVNQDYPSFPPTMPDPNSDAQQLYETSQDVFDALKVNYPNAKLIFLSTRSFAATGLYANRVNPEPFAYEGGFALKWLIADHLEESEPWIGWGPYWWTDAGFGCEHYESDGIHYLPSGEEIEADMLRVFFLRSPETRPWFVAHPADIDDDGVVGFADVLYLLSAWGGDDHIADLDGNGVVGFGDLLMLLEAWG